MPAAVYIRTAVVEVYLAVQCVREESSVGWKGQSKDDRDRVPLRLE